jgi:acetoin utilization deacetylase AcuC-like enzyme
LTDAVALYYDPVCLGHDTLTHPENAGRLAACMKLLEESGLAARLERPPCRDATVEELARVHSRGHIGWIRQVGEDGPVMVLADTIANKGTYDAAVRAAGACLAATEAVVHGDFAGAFCLTRPPGHHALPNYPMGFCFFNTIAVAGRHARAALGLERVAIVDIDIHHGNGTQEVFLEDPSVLYVSTHQYGGAPPGFYPGTGDWREAGEGAGRGCTLNLSLPGGCGDVEYARCLDEVIAPKLRGFRPQLLLVSAGYDAHYADPISDAEMRLSCAGYTSMVARLKDLASELCDGRIVLTLEGGYDLTALPWSVRNSIEALLGEVATPDPLGPAPEAAAPGIGDLLASVKELHRL